MKTLKERMKINADRVKKSENKKRSLGFVRVMVWVQKDKADDIRKLAKIFNSQHTINILKDPQEKPEGGTNG